MLTQKELKALVEYDQDTGVFIWKPREHNSKFTSVFAGKVAGRIANNGYADICIHYKRFGAHRLAWLYVTGQWPVEIDHINGDRADNRFENLRNCTHIENCQNYGVRASNKSGFTGASLHRKSGLWRASIRANGRVKHLGVHKTPQEAHEAYLAAKRKFHSFNPTVRQA